MTSTVEPGAPILEVTGLQTHFAVGASLFRAGDVVRAVDDVTFDVRAGEIFGLVGESGSGKTTLGRTVLGLEPATAGSVKFRGEELVGLSERRLRPLRRDMSMVFQDPNASLNPAMTVGQGVGHPLRIHGMEETRAGIRRRTAEMLERCGLAPAARFLDTYPEDLSGGQKQRAVIARALITEPKLVVADEPVAALDMSVRAKVLQLMLDLKDELGLTYLYITHDLSSGRFVCDRMAIMYLGRMVEWGDAHAIYDDPHHPYTRALLEAIPLPDPSRRGRDRELPHGEIPDALNPPAGCRFHPRCRLAFAPCGWEGRDVVEAIEQRWTTVDERTVASELAAVGGDLGAVVVEEDLVRFPGGDAVQLRSVIDDIASTLPVRVADGVAAVEADGNDAVVRMQPRQDPRELRVSGRAVSCHLHDPQVSGVV